MATSIVLTEDQILENLASEKEFPIDFDKAWQWAGYSRKQGALIKLKKHFEEGADFLHKGCKSSSGGRSSASYSLTNDCFKMFCMMAGTDKGKEVRRYYINCEQRLKGQSQKAFATPFEESLAIAEGIKALLSTAHLGSTPAESANLLAGAGLSVVGIRHPELKAELMEGHKLLASATPTPSVFLTPTTIGRELGKVSARTVNNLLIDVGLQTRVPKESQKRGEPDYRPTEKGQKYASNTLSTGHSGDKTTYQHIKWTEDVVGVLREFMASAVDS